MLLGLDNVPVSVERRIDGKKAAVTWWIDGVAMDENDRMAKQPRPALSPRMAGQIQNMRVFDELIGNTDRNGGNMLRDKGNTLWMIDHSRGFRTSTVVRNPKAIEQCDRQLLAKVRSLTADDIKKAAGDSLGKKDIASMLSRRDALVKLFDGLVAERGEAKVLFTLPPR